MKILQINKFFYPRGGADAHFLDLINLLTQNGQEVAPFAMRHAKNLPSPYSNYFVSETNFEHLGWSAVTNFSRVLYSFEAKKKLDSLIKVFKPDIAHLHLIYHHLSPSVLVALKKNNIPVVLTAHDWKLICPNHLLYTQNALCTRCRNKKYWQATRYACVKNKFLPSVLASLEAYFHETKKYYHRNIDLLIAPSRFVKEMFIHFGWPEDKIKILPHFLPSTFAPIKSGAAAAGQNFVCAGRLSPEKGIVELVDYWQTEKLPYELKIFGEGPLYKTLAKKIISAGNIKLFGRAERQNLAAQIQNATAVIIPSMVYETFGLIGIESLAMGTPIIASRRGALTEIVTNSNAGVMFDWQSIGAATLKEAVAEVLSAEQELRKNALAYMSENHNQNTYFEELMKIYSQVLALSPKAARYF